MRKFLMVDDEDVIRAGFRETIDWAALGFEFLEPCAHGLQALEAVNRHHPDVVMTDVCMPQMDGLELCRVLARDFPDIRVVVLSGHDDFEYAREALRHRAVDYILKPLTAGELRAFLLKLRADLDKKRPLSEAEAVDRLAAGVVDAVLPLELPCPADRAWWLAGRIRVPRAEVALATLETALGDRPRPWPGLARLVVRPAPAPLAIDLLFPADSPERADLIGRRETWTLVTALREAGFASSAAVAEPVGSVALIAGALAEADQRLLLRFTRGSDQPGLFTPSPGNSSLDALADRLDTMVREGDRPALSGLLSELSRALAAFEGPVGTLRHGLDRLAGPLDVCEADDRPALVAWVGRRAAAALEEAALRGASVADRALARFRVEIGQRFGDPDLSVDEVARALPVSPSYLSKLLRRRLGTNFSRYLREVRISRAKELLTGTDLTTTAISQQAGYNDYRYFSQQFKRLTGTTPSAYRASFRVDA